MPSVAKFPDEPPTKPSENVPSRALIRAARIVRVATLAIERLMVAPDENAITAAVGDLCEIRALAGEVL
jgi:hypothetical protein